MGDELIDFYRDIDKIKHIEREGWVRRGPAGIKDTIGSHSYGAALLGMVISRREEADTAKVIKLLLVHDLVMAHINDWTPKEEEYKTKKELEDKAFIQVIKACPADARNEVRMLFQEYQEENTRESVIARECDKLDTLLQALMYSERLGKDILSEFIGSYEKKFKTKTGKNILIDLKAAAKKFG